MSIKKNIIYSMVYQILIMILPLLTSPYISRIIGANGIGTYSYTYSIASYFVLFAMLGLNNYGNRAIAEVKDDEAKLNQVFSSIYYLQVIMSIISIIIYYIFISFFSVHNQQINYIQGIWVISTLLDINWLFFGLEKIKLTVMRNTLIKILTLIFIFIFIKEEDDLIKYTTIMSIGTLLSNGLLWIFIKDNVKLKKIKFKEIYAHFYPTLILFIPIVAVSIYKIMDKIMLGSISGVIEVGYYENAEKIINIPNSIIIALGTVMLPRIVNLRVSGEGLLVKDYIKNSISFVMFISIGAFFGLISISNNFIPLFYGKEFYECVPVVNLLAITIIFLSWSNVIRTQYLIPYKKDSIFIKSTIVGAGINVIFNIILIPIAGAVGAAIGTIAAEFSVCLYQSIKVYKELNIIQYLKSSIIFLLPGFTMYLLNSYLESYIESNILCLTLQIILGLLVYSCLSIIFFIIMNKAYNFRFRSILSTQKN